MTPNPVSVTMDDTLTVVKEIFSNANMHHLLVVEDNKLMGVISDRDLLLVLTPALGTPAEQQRDRATLNMRAHQIMSRKLFTVTVGDSLNEALELFKSQKISCLPVLNSEKKPVGIISWRDIIRIIEL